MWSRRGNNDESQDGRSYNVQYRSAYQVVHSADATDDEIRNASDGTTTIPAIRSTLAGKPGVFCVRREVEMVSPILSVVTVTHVGELGTGESNLPENQPPEMEYQSVEVNEPADRDAYGTPLTNTVGDPVTGLQGTIQDMALRVTRNFLSVNGNLALQYLNSTNSDVYPVLGTQWQPGTAHLRAYSARPVFDQFGNVSYFSVSAEVHFRYPINTVNARAWWYRYRNEGLRKRYATRVTFSGGGGSGASGYAVATSGAVTAVVITNRGRDYTSAPTVAFASDTGGASAAGTAVLGTGQYAQQVVSVTITNGGTGYKSGVMPILDANKEPITSPVLLKANGEEEPNADNAFFCERPKFPFYLPYRALGLLD
jgi:hypothetical protein